MTAKTTPAILMPATQDEAAPPRRRAKPKDPSAVINTRWATTATDELEQFRRAPLIGSLPWRSQYMLTTAGVAICLLMTLMFVSMGGHAPEVVPSQNIQVQAAAQGLVELSRQTLSGQPLDQSSLQRLIQIGGSAVQSAGARASKDWLSIEAAAKDAALTAPEAVGVPEAALKVSSLRQDLAAIAPLWRQAGESGQWSSVPAVNLAQVLAQLQSLGAISEEVAQHKSSVGPYFSVYLQALDQAFRVFSASPEASQNSTITQAWRAAAAAFLRIRPSALSLATRSTAWDRLHDDIERSIIAQSALARSAAITLPPTAAGNEWAQRGAAFSALGALLFLIIMLWVGWKQQRWHALSARASQELVEREAQELMRSVQGVEHGDLTTRVNVSSHVLGTLGDSLNRTVEGMRTLVLVVRNNADAAGAAAVEAATAAAALAEGMQEQLGRLVDGGGVILRASEQSAEASSQARAVLELAAQTASVASDGMVAIAGSREHIQEVRRCNEDAAARAEQLKQSSREIAGIADVINDIAEQTEVLAAQASLQANKAGEHGRGFLVVAAGVRDLAERSGDYARRVNARIENVQADLEKLAEAFTAALLASDEGARLSDVSQETWLGTEARLSTLKTHIEGLRSTVEATNVELQNLGNSTQDALEQVEGHRQKAEFTRQSVVQLLDRSGVLRDSVSRFRV
jgi:methyl-accepting chemotaxis protein